MVLTSQEVPIVLPGVVVEGGEDVGGEELVSGSVDDGEVGDELEISVELCTLVELETTTLVVDDEVEATVVEQGVVGLAVTHEHKADTELSTPIPVTAPQPPSTQLRAAS